MGTDESAPVVLAIGGHDPSGAAGIQADIESVGQCGAHCVTLLTATTAQNTQEFAAVYPQPVEVLRHAARLLLADLRPAACKIGLLGSIEAARFVGELLPQLGPLPLVIDPVLRSGSGTDLADEALLESYRACLLGRASVITPNAAEVRMLGRSADSAEAAQNLIALGAGAVLVTGADEATPGVVNVLYCADGVSTRFEYRRLPGTYHGSGCTLAAALAALLARGRGLLEAVRLAQDYTHTALSAGRRLGRGQIHPDRLAARPVR